MLFQSQEIEEHPSDHSEYERIKTHHDPSFGLTSCDIKPKPAYIFWRRKLMGTIPYAASAFIKKLWME